MKTKVIFLMLLIILGTVFPSSARDSFLIGVAPHTSARVILEMYQPLRQYMEKAIDMPVSIVTATDFDTFARRGLKGEFDIAITTGHQARLLQTDAGYIPLLTYAADFKAVVLVNNSGSIRKFSDLSGKQVLGLSPTSLVTLWGLHWMKENRIDPSSIKYISASDSVAQLLLSGEAAAGFTSLVNYQKLAPDVRGKLRILSESRPMAGRVYVLNKRNTLLQKRIDAALWSFAATSEGKQYFENNRLEGYRKLRPRELREMDSYANEVRKALKSGAK